MCAIAELFINGIEWKIRLDLGMSQLFANSEYTHPLVICNKWGTLVDSRILF